jgi:single-stranded-DNA-specific exonuclease
MEQAVERLEHARCRDELVWVHGDYDVDGVSSTALLVEFLRRSGLRVHHQVPNRFAQGYGLTVESAQQALQAGAGVLIAVDCGTNSTEAIAWAQERGLDVLICDHHELLGELPPARALLNPRWEGSGYGFPDLAACGVVYKLVCALAERWGVGGVEELTDLVALATVADLVPMRGENRVLTTMGLERINRQPRAGIAGLLHCSGLEPGSVGAAEVIFSLAPRLNAAGRLGDARRAVELLLQSDTGLAFRIAQELECENFRRRALAEQVSAQAFARAEELLAQGRRSVVLYDPNWHPGVLGTAATRIAERFRVPVVLLSDVGGFLKGSARSGGAVNLLTLLASCSAHLYEYGGHPFAAGVVLRPEQLEPFAAALEQAACQEQVQPAELPEMFVDAQLELVEITPRFLALLRRMEPFGYGNYRPVFLTHGVTLRPCNGNSCRVHQGSVQLSAQLMLEPAIVANATREVGAAKTVSIFYTITEQGRTGEQPGLPLLRIYDVCPDSAQPCVK